MRNLLLIFCLFILCSCSKERTLVEETKSDSNQLLTEYYPAPDVDIKEKIVDFLSKVRS